MTGMNDKLKVPKAMQPLFDTVSGIIDQFCRSHLNEEYSLVSREGQGYHQRAYQAYL